MILNAHHSAFKLKIVYIKKNGLTAGSMIIVLGDINLVIEKITSGS